MKSQAGRAWLVWGVGAAAYLVAVLQRSSLGVAGLDASERFHVSAGVLSLMVVAQLVTYAVLQIPMGILVDAVGARAMIVSGALAMAVGQAWLAFAPTVALAVAGRVLVGAGDAMTFISVIALANTWFGTRQVPLMTQFTGLVGQCGQILSALPFVLVLRHMGWSAAFTSAGALSLLAGVLAFAVVANSPSPHPQSAVSFSPSTLWGNVRAVWRQAGTRVGFWVHFVSPFSGTVFALFWGYPFLIRTQGFTPQAASALLTLLVVSAMIAGPIIGVVVGNRTVTRTGIVVVTALLSMGAWAMVLLNPGPSPWWVLVGLAVLLGIGGPVSMIGFDYARLANGPSRVGTATGVVNTGGFVAALTTVLLVGLLLNLTGSGLDFSPGGFRWALASQWLIWAAGLTGFLITRRRLL
jgi:MFS family permease